MSKELQECTFEPKINHVSKKRPARSIDEISKGDFNKLAEKLKLKKDIQERKELDGFTFQPRITPKPNVQSYLKVSSDPENYLLRVSNLLKKQV